MNIKKEPREKAYFMQPIHQRDLHNKTLPTFFLQFFALSIAYTFIYTLSPLLEMPNHLSCIKPSEVIARINVFLMNISPCISLAICSIPFVLFFFHNKTPSFHVKFFLKPNNMPHHYV